MAEENKTELVKALSTGDRIFSIVSKCGAYAGALIVLAITLMIFFYVINRAFIGQVWLFVEEWAGLSLIAIAYLGMGYTLRRNKHIRVDILVNRFSPRVQRILEAIVGVFSIIILAFMLERSINWLGYTIENNVRSAGPMRTPLWIFSFILVSGLVMYIIDSLFFVIHKIVEIAQGKSPLDFDD